MITIFVLDFATELAGSTSIVIDSLDDFASTYSVSYPAGDDRHPNDWQLNKAIFDQDLEPIFAQGLEPGASGVSLSVESPTAGDAYSTIEFDEWGNATVTHPDGRYDFVMRIFPLLIMMVMGLSITGFLLSHGRVRRHLRPFIPTGAIMMSTLRSTSLLRKSTKVLVQKAEVPFL